MDKIIKGKILEKKFVKSLKILFENIKQKKLAVANLENRGI